MSVILMYHSVSHDVQDDGIQIHPDTLARQLEWVAEEGYRWASLEEVIRQPRDKTAAVTFDDGFADFHDAIPILIASSAPATLFICPSLTGGTSSWTTNANLRSRPLLSVDQLRNLRRPGVELACHGWTHKSFLEKTPRQLTIEAARCQLWFLEHFDFQPGILAYPFGKCDHARAAAIAGVYDYAVVVERLVGVSARYNIPRLPALESASHKWFCQQLRMYDLSTAGD